MRNLAPLAEAEGEVSIVKTRLIAMTAILFLALAPFASSAADFARTWGDSSDDAAFGITVDGKGNIYLAGYTESTQPDALLLKYSGSGTLLWKRAWTSGRLEWARAVRVGPDGQIVLVVQLEPGLIGEADPVIMRFDANGNLLWARAWSTPLWQPGGRLALDGAGNIYLATCTTVGPNPYNGLILKFDVNGNLLFSKVLDSEIDCPGSIALDAKDNVYLSARHANPSPKKVLLYKLDSANNLVWVRKWDAALFEEDADIKLDQAGNIYVTGTFNNHGPFPPSDVFLLKFSPSGTLLWGRGWDSGANDGARGMFIDDGGNIYVTGSTDVLGQNGILLLRFDSSGNFHSSRVWMGTSAAAGNVITMDSSGDLLFAGVAANNQGSWQDVSGTASSLSGTVSVLSGSVHDVSGIVTALTGTLYMPGGVENLGGGRADALLLRLALAITVKIDIRPGSFPNSWRCGQVDGNIPVAILSTVDFDARTVDALSVRLGKAGTEAGEVHAQGHLEDVNRDGRIDMLFHFRFGDTGFSCADIPTGQSSVTLTGKLTGKTTSGTPLRGEDTLRLVR